ncbi:MAG: transposase [Acetobacteraceae bacterium]
MGTRADARCRTAGDEPWRVDDRRMMIGIVHRSREGRPWRPMPPDYGPYTTVFNRWAAANAGRRQVIAASGFGSSPPASPAPIRLGSRRGERHRHPG